MKRLFILGAALVAALVPLSVAPAHADGVTVVVEGCAVTVPAGVDGVAVLDAAVASGCPTITSYSVTYFPGYGAFLDCLNGVCGESLFTPPDYPVWAGTGWSFHANGPYSSFGLSGYQAKNLDVLAFTYEGYAFPAV